MPDSQIRCSDCGELFLFSEQEQAFFAEKGLNTPPKRCKPCRQARKTASPSGGGAGGGGFGDRAPRPGGRARPSTGGFGDRSRGAPARGAPPRGGEGGWRPRDAGAGPARAPASQATSSNGPRPSGGAPRESGGWKTPHAPHAPPPGARARDARERTFAGPAPTSQQTQQAPRQQAPRDDDAKPAARERAAKPKFDITCAECGAPSQVPFKPLEGRQVYCQPCYRLRKIASPDAAAPRNLDAQGADSGIVE